MSKNVIVSVRMSVLDLQRLQALAIVFDETLASLIQKAVIAYIEERKSEPNFQKELEAAKKRQTALLDQFHMI
ncbi:MAG: hypothetical protein A2746_01220 [Candidatus Yanofskybacteria bacterium RIFCSPHIGHO2_01_FULL_44_22]|uniref:Ribbon-helix-helix protein CopG domain-containing protein n=1 Tax=Candidatus Yanofskybacteria bacterium RIFCSPHIGHO2_01_FULL_44_22 TaxID=1802669 RepID=A0A1F8EWU4_9BACT|nr:MAG: hypothetical protein A2746_01220 [Candidatus Yanofskybacteria bacterium RIFCSPHIGHO2_01_FULL_44_22]